MTISSFKLKRQEAKTDWNTAFQLKTGDDFPFRKPSTPSVLETLEMLADFVKNFLKERKSARLHKAVEREEAQTIA